jgi:transposase
MVGRKKELGRGISLRMSSPEVALSGVKYVGLDVHRKSVTATVLDAGGKLVRQTKFGSTDSELTQFLEDLSGPRKVALEACAMWAHFYDAAASTGAEVVLSDPFKTHLISKTGRKTDKVDSKALATLLRLEALPTVYAPPAATRRLRSLVRERIFYRRKTKGIMLRIYHELIARGIEYEDRILTYRRKRETLRTLELPLVSRGLDAIDALEIAIRDLTREIEEAWETSPEAQLLTTIPGVGKFTAVALVAYLCPIERFQSVDEISSYVGLVPTTRQSGETLVHGHLKRDSNELVRTLMVEATWSHCLHFRRGPVARIAQRVARKSSPGKGTVAGAHKLLKIVYAMLKRKEPFRHTAPRPSTAMVHLRRPRTTVLRSVRRATLEP